MCEADEMDKIELVPSTVWRGHLPTFVEMAYSEQGTGIVEAGFQRELLLGGMKVNDTRFVVLLPSW